MGKQATQYLTLEEASEISRIPVSTLRKKIALGLLRAFKPGKNVVVTPDDLDTFIKKSKVNNAS